MEPEKKKLVIALTKEEAEMCGKKIIDYFDQFHDVTDYYMSKKIEKLKSFDNKEFDGFDDWDDEEESFSDSNKLFDGYSIEPKDMDIQIIPVYTKAQGIQWDNLTQITATFPIENMPGRVVKLLVKEMTSGKILGMLRVGGPTLNMAPRNQIMKKIIEPKVVNHRIINGTVIVPAQPFGFNMLGGKLMALICSSNYTRDFYNDKYNTDIRIMETTSLYGSVKTVQGVSKEGKEIAVAVSQYDGLKPYIRYGGNTDSKFPMNLSDEIHAELVKFFVSKNENFAYEYDTGSVKMKMYLKMLSTIKNTLKETKSDYYNEFVEGLENAQNLTTKKRYYYCDYGVENLLDSLDGKDIQYKNGMSREKFDLENIIEWWKKKAQKRYETLKKQDRLRTELEFWTTEKAQNKSIDIVR